MSDWSENMATMLGKQVTVTLADGDPRAVAKGQLMSFTEDGEIVILDEVGTLHWCWPNLKCESSSE